MRNLALTSESIVNFSTGNIVSLTYDLDEDIAYVASERLTLDGEVEVDLWKNPCVSIF